MLKNLEDYYVTKAYFRHESPQFFAEFLMRRGRGGGLKGGLTRYNDGTYTFGRHSGILEGEPDFEKNKFGHYEKCDEELQQKT